MTYLVEFHAITKILLKKLPKIFNYQKSQRNREILPKVIKITKSGHTEQDVLHCLFPACQVVNGLLTTCYKVV
jgi:hypothetical protein